MQIENDYILERVEAKTVLRLKLFPISTSRGNNNKVKNVMFNMYRVKCVYTQKA